MGRTILCSCLLYVWEAFELRIESRLTQTKSLSTTTGVQRAWMLSSMLIRERTVAAKFLFSSTEEVRAPMAAEFSFVVALGWYFTTLHSIKTNRLLSEAFSVRLSLKEKEEKEENDSRLRRGDIAPLRDRRGRQTTHFSTTTNVTSILFFACNSVS